LFSAGPSTDVSWVNTYKITIKSVTLSNGVTYAGTSQILSGSAEEKFFYLSVTAATSSPDPCASATIYGPTTIENFTVFAGKSQTSL
jgi:hypothetical protein